MKKRRPFYGYYALPILGILIVAILTVGATTTIFFWPAGVPVLAFGVYLALSYGVSMFVARQHATADLPNILRLRGDEMVLDVGCGLGKTAIAVAKHLDKGKVIGIDIWNKMEILGNSPQRAYENAESEGVRGRVEFQAGNVVDIPFSDNSFDLVTAGSVLNNLERESDRVKSLKEIYRVLRPGGRFLLMEPLRNLRGFFLFTPFGFLHLSTKETWLRLLSGAGFVATEYSYHTGMGCFLAEKFFIEADTQSS